MTRHELRRIHRRQRQARYAQEGLYSDITGVGQILIILGGILFLIAAFSDLGFRSPLTIALGAFNMFIAVVLIAFNISKERYERRLSKERLDLTHYLVDTPHLPYEKEESYLIAEKWAPLPLPLDRKKLLLAAGISTAQALTPATLALTDEDLSVMWALQRDTANGVL